MKVMKLTHENLVDLLCTATYGSTWLDCSAPNKNGINVEDSDCREDIWARVLLSGGKIECIDYYAEGDVYSALGRIDEDEDGIYAIGLKDIERGLRKAMNGTFKGDDEEKAWARKCYSHFIDGDGAVDNPEAECLMQIIMFNEIIYG